MTIFDWKKDKEFALANGFENRDYLPEQLAITATKKIFEDCTFRNFPNLNADGIQFYNCTFEDCAHLSFESSDAYNCSFRRIVDLYMLRSAIKKSQFYEMKSNPETFCDSDSPIFMEDGKISLCNFNDMELRNGAYLCESFGNDCKVEYCTFTNCRTDREDRKLFHGEKSVKKLLGKKAVENNIVDEETQKALRCVAGLDGAVENSSFEL